MFLFWFCFLLLPAAPQSDDRQAYRQQAGCNRIPGLHRIAAAQHPMKGKGPGRRCQAGTGPAKGSGPVLLPDPQIRSMIPRTPDTPKAVYHRKRKRRMPNQMIRSLGSSGEIVIPSFPLSDPFLVKELAEQLHRQVDPILGSHVRLQGFVHHRHGQGTGNA